MHASLQARVLALVGIGVFLAVAALSLLSRSTLLSLEDELRHDHERLAASLARDLARALRDDLRLLSGGSGGYDSTIERLRQVSRFGRLTTAAFVVDQAGSVVSCEPAFQCRGLDQQILVSAAQQAAATQRPFVGNALDHGGGLSRIVSAMPVRQAGTDTVLASGIVIDPHDRRLVELLQVDDIAPTLRLRLTDGQGHPIAAREHARPESPSYITVVNVSGTPWQLALSDVGPDPGAPIAAFRQRSIWMAPSLAALATLLGWGIARSVRQPLVDLTGAAERIAAGNLDQPIDTARAARGGEEIARLAAALDHMRQDLLASIRRIESANAQLETRIAERTQELAGLNRTLEDRERLRQHLLRQLISAQEDERKRIARELHDETSQSLAALGIGVDLARTASAHADGAETVRRLEDVRSIVDRMHQELHRMIVNLRPSVLDDLGLAAAIRWFAERHLTAAGVAVRCEFSGLDTRLPPEIETATFRTVQEALVNVTRHAAAETVLIQAALADGQLTIEIEDDGSGFDEGSVVRSPDSMRGIGLLGMRERIEILGGDMVIESSAGSGTRVFFSIPVPPAPTTADRPS